MNVTADRCRSDTDVRKSRTRRLKRTQSNRIRVCSVENELPFFQNSCNEFDTISDFGKFFRQFIASNNLPGLFTRLAPALRTSSVHRPAALSPQKWTLINGQSSKEESSTSRGRSNNSTDCVPDGEVSLKRARVQCVLVNLPFLTQESTKQS